MSVTPTAPTALAAVFTGPEDPISIETIALRSPGPGEALVRVDAAAVCVTDVLALDGVSYAPPPFVSGHAAAGTVEEVGPGTDRIRPGQRVVVVGTAECGTCYSCVRGTPSACDEILAGMVPPRVVGTRRSGQRVVADGGIGVFTERMVYRHVNLVPVDSGLPAEHLALLGCGVTSGLGAVFSVARVQPGDTVAVVGCGHLGLWIVQAARLAGASRIVAVEPRPGRRALAERFGATDLLEATGDEAVTRVKDLTGGRGADVTFDAGGSADSMRQAFLMARLGGTVVPTSMERPGATVTLPAFEYSVGAKRILSCQTGTGHIRRDVPRFAALLEDGRIDAGPIVDRIFPLERIDQAVEAARARTVVTGVVLP